MDRGPGLRHFLGRGSRRSRALTGHLAVDQKSVPRGGLLFLPIYGERNGTILGADAKRLELSPRDDGLACRSHEGVSGEPKRFPLRRAKEDRA